jgi:Methyltransferase domain
MQRGTRARDLQQRGLRLVAIDLSERLLRYAKGADSAGAYVVAKAAYLPVADSSRDLVVAYNSLMDVADMPATAVEVARILESGRRLCVCVTHPLSEAGHFVSDRAESVCEIAGSYVGRRSFEGTEERDGSADVSRLELRAGRNTPERSRRRGTRPFQLLAHNAHELLSLEYPYGLVVEVPELLCPVGDAARHVYSVVLDCSAAPAAIDAVSSAQPNPSFVRTMPNATATAIDGSCGERLPV